MNPFTVNGRLWEVLRVPSTSELLIDRTGMFRVATCNPDTRTIYISSDLEPPFLDRVLLHEVSHAISISYGLIDGLQTILPGDLAYIIDEISAQLIENYSMETIEAATIAIGRPICVDTLCSNAL